MVSCRSRQFSIWIFIFFLLSFWNWGEADPLIDASIDMMHTQAHFPLTGILTITHDKDEKIDPTSFTLEGKALEVSLEREVLMSASSDTLVAIYHFQLPGQKEGLYVLPEISVKIGGKTYHSAPTSYEVRGGTPSHAAPSTAPAASDAASPLIFRLEAAVKGPTTLYPGERTKLFYRITYNRSVDLTKSELPMIHPANFQKVGDVLIQDFQEKDVTIQDLTQEVVAATVGRFQFGPSFIEGYAYTMKGIQKVYGTTLLQAKAPAITIEVKPFPLKQPPSFTGALGKIHAEASLESSSTVSVGDVVQVQIKISGITNLAELHLSLLQCQPGFSGFFQTSDLPPLAEVIGEEKIFHLEMRPMTSLISQIPSIELSSFDTTTGQYVIQQTNPLPLTVNAHSIEKTPTLRAPLISSLPSSEQWPSPVLSPLEFEAEPIQLAATHRHWLGMGTLLWLLPLGLGLLMLQQRLHRWMRQRPPSKTLTSDELWAQAFQFDFSKGSRALSLLEQAFWHRLWEKGIIQRGEFDLNKLTQNDNLKAVREFLYELQDLQYGQSKEFNPSQLKHTAKELFNFI